MPPDWDVLGALPPRKRAKRDHPPLPHPTEKSVAERSASSKSVAEGSASSTPRGTPQPGPGPRFPKHRITMAPKEGLSDQVARLTRDNAELRAFADEKITALTIFGVHQDNALWLISKRFEDLKLEKDEHTREQLEMDINAILEKSDNAVVCLRERFPSLEPLLAEHDGTSDVSITAAFKSWLAQPDHIQKTQEELLRKG